MTLNEAIIKEFNLKLKPVARKDTKIGFCIIPEAPYDEYKHGIIYTETKNGRSRKYIRLGRCKSKNEAPKFGRMHTFARYAFQVQLWKTKQKLIPEGYEVDHINDDSNDDRLDNYQLLTAEDNLKKARLNDSSLVAVLVCPVCITRFEKPASTTQYAEHNKAKKLIFYCCTRCHMASEFTMQSHEKYRPLRDWISDNQIYKLVRVWTNGKTKLEAILSEQMLNFDLCKATGVSINYGSPKFASTNEKKAMIRDYRNQGLTIYEIANKMQLHFSTVWDLTGETKKSIDLSGDELHETLLRIKHYRNQDYSEERIGRLLNIPRTSISNYIRRHSKQYGIKNEGPVPKGESVVTLVCPICKSIFERPLKLTQLLSSRHGRVMCCTGDCRWEFKIKLNRVIDREVVRKWISENQIIKVDKVMPNGIRFKEKEIEYDPKIKTFDWELFNKSELYLV